MIWLILFVLCLVMPALTFAIGFSRVKRDHLRRYPRIYPANRFPDREDLSLLVVAALTWPAGLPVILMTTRKFTMED